jgi:hypothetical protein
MAILNSFVNDIFERIATEASSMCSDSIVVDPSLNLRFRTRCLLQKIDDIFSGDSDICTTYPAW